MNRRLACLFSLTLLAACAHGAPSGFVPNTNQSPSLLGRNAAASGTLIVTITVPETRPGFVASSTKSMVIAVYNRSGKTLLAKKIANIGVKARGCGSTGSSFTCVIAFSVAAGKDLVSATTFDKAKGRGNALAALLKYPHKISASKPTVLGLALGGIAKSIDLEPISGGSPQATGGYAIGHGTATFALATKDADGNVILGSKVPQVKVVGDPEDATIATPAPNVLAITSTYVSADPTVGLATSVKLQASPVPHTGGKTLKATVPITLYQPRIYVADYSTGKILAFDEDGNAVALSAGAFTLPHAGYLIYSPSNKLIYADEYSSNVVKAFNLAGTEQTLSGTFTGLNYPGQLALDTKNNLIYVPNYSATTTGQVTVYDLQGVAQTTPPGFAGMENGAWLMSYDPVHDRLYGYNYNTSFGGAWNSSGTLVSTGLFAGMASSYGLAVDTENGQIYSGNDRPPTVYDQAGNPVTVSGSWANVPEYSTFAYDPFIDKFFVASYPGYATTVLQYDAEGNQQTLKAGAFGGLVQPMGVLVVP